MQSTGHTVAQELQDVQLSLLITLRYRVSFFRSGSRVRKYSVMEIVIGSLLPVRICAIPPITFAVAKSYRPHGSPAGKIVHFGGPVAGFPASGKNTDCRKNPVETCPRQEMPLGSPAYDGFFCDSNRKALHCRLRFRSVLTFDSLSVEASKWRGQSDERNSPGTLI